MQSTNNPLPGTPINSFKSPLNVGVLCEAQTNNIMNTEDDYEKPIKSQDGRSGWESIRQLDDCENWSERNTVISKHDHLFYSECAQEFVNDIVDDVPTRSSGDFEEIAPSSGSYLPPPSPYKEPIPPVRNVSNSPPLPPPHSPSEDTIYYTPQDPPIKSTGNYKNMEEFGDEEFQTTSNQLDMDYLERVSAHCNPQVTSALARESLFVKFDPLVGKNSPIRHSQKRALPPIISSDNDNLLMLDTPPSHSNPRNTQVTYSSSSHNVRTEQGNLVDVSSSNTAQHLDISDRTTTPRSNRESSPHAKSLFDTSPASFQQQTRIPPTFRSTNSEREDELIKVLIYSESDLRNVVHQVRNECEIQNEETISLVKIDHAEELSKQQKKIDRLVREIQNLRAHNAVGRTEKIVDTEQGQDYQELCSKYSETEVELLDAYEELKNEAKRVEEERDQSLRDFASLERSFTDFHQRYNKSKELVTSLQKTVAELQDHIRKNDNLTKKVKIQNSKLQEETVLKLQEANETFEQLKRESASEVAVMKANTKKMSVQLASLERQLQQKEQEKSELTQICEDLMKELSSKS